MRVWPSLLFMYYTVGWCDWLLLAGLRQDLLYRPLVFDQGVTPYSDVQDHVTCTRAASQISSRATSMCSLRALGIKASTPPPTYLLLNKP
ncbi:hypothetical protein HDK64DRAFT_279467 [Phyllosticta capitalensis]